MLIFVSVLSMIAAALLWLELIIRAAMLYVGAALATAVYAGFVDKSMWGHIRRWIGLMISIDLIKPIIVIVLSLATAVSSGSQDSFSAVLSGLAIMILSIFASGLVYRFVPAFGDEMLTLQKERAAKIGKAAITSAAFTSPAGTMRNGMAAHANRISGAFAGGGGGGNMGSAIAGMSVGALAGGAGAAAGHRGAHWQGPDSAARRRRRQGGGGGGGKRRRRWRRRQRRWRHRRFGDVRLPPAGHSGPRHPQDPAATARRFLSDPAREARPDEAQQRGPTQPARAVATSAIPPCVFSPTAPVFAPVARFSRGSVESRTRAAHHDHLHPRWKAPP